MSFWRKKEVDFEIMADIIEQNGNRMSIEALATYLNVSRTTIDRRLPSMDDAGIRLAEDDDGYLSVVSRPRR